MTKISAIAFALGISLGCEGESHQRVASQVAAATTDTLSSAVAHEPSPALPPGQAATHPATDTLNAVTKNSLPVLPDDSITRIGGGIIDDTYWAHEYLRNGVRYAGIAQEIGTKPNGQPLMGEVSTVTLPSMDSTEHLMFSGLCGTDYKSDPYVLAVVGIGGDSVYRNIRKAWRFDRSAKVLREIPTTNVVCFDPGEN